MEIQVGEYVRVMGIITKLFKIVCKGDKKTYYFDRKVLDGFNFLSQYGIDQLVRKHSFEIIDLIEKGDFVNRLEIEKIIEPTQYTNYKKTLYCSESEGLYKGVFFNNDIKSVVTHEQMEAMEYEVK